MKKPFGIIVLVIIILIGGVLLVKNIDREGQEGDTSVNGNVVSPDEAIGRYENPEFGFSFVLPDGYEAAPIVTPDDPSAATMITIRKNAGSPIDALQIAVSLFDEPAEALTFDRINSELPDLQVKNPQALAIPGASGLRFESSNLEWGGASVEAWFVESGSLYQVTTYKENTATLDAVIETWKFRTEGE